VIVAVVGAGGFVGSAFVRELERRRVVVVPITRDGPAHGGLRPDVVVDAAGNSRKYLADEAPQQDFEATVAHRLRTLLDFPAAVHLHVSTIDVYSDLRSPGTTGESTPLVPERASRYGAHKMLAEMLVRHYATRWLIVRLGGMVGPGLKKNPVHDILNRAPLRIHPDSRYQFMATDDVARLSWDLLQGGAAADVFNVCGAGLVSPRDIARWAGRELNLTAGHPAEPRIVEANIDKVARQAIVPVTEATVRAFLAETGCQ
jgi:nucleoside-diphosphate-sugar epimerase